MSNANRIVKILRVEDTRTYEEQGDRWVPVPGSGNANDCARCGRSHEVHATVELDDGAAFVVGTGCMHADEAELAARIRSATSAAKTLARLRAELAAHEARRAAYRAAVADVVALPVPAIEYEQAPMMPVRCGDAVVYCHLTGYTTERENAARAAWRANRIAERGFSRPVGRNEDLERRAARAERKAAS